MYCLETWGHIRREKFTFPPSTNQDILANNTAYACPYWPAGIYEVFTLSNSSSLCELCRLESNNVIQSRQDNNTPREPLVCAYLMHNTRARRHNLEALECRRSPLEEGEALVVALDLTLLILEGSIRTNSIAPYKKELQTPYVLAHESA